jgi:hypothetical protein
LTIGRTRPRIGQAFQRGRRQRQARNIRNPDDLLHRRHRYREQFAGNGKGDELVVVLGLVAGFIAGDGLDHRF